MQGLCRHIVDLHFGDYDTAKVMELRGFLRLALDLENNKGYVVRLILPCFGDLKLVGVM